MNESPALWVLVIVAVGGILYCVLRLAIQQSIIRGIKLVADEQLEKLKSELASRVEGIRHEYQLTQLRTSLLFEHERAAFAQVLGRIAEVKREWFNSAHEPYAGITGPVPNDQYKKLLDTYYEHQLFLDSDCLAAMELILDALRASFPFEDANGKVHPRNCDAAYQRLVYLQPRVTEIFQEKLGFAISGRGKEEVALLGAILLLNSYHFREIQLPVKGPLKVAPQDWPADAVAKAEANRGELLRKLKEFRGYLCEGHGVFHQARTDISRYVAMLEGKQDQD